MINPAALLPGAAPSMVPSSSSGVSSSSLSPSPATTPIGTQTDSEGGVSFDTPVQISILQSVHKVGFLHLGVFILVTFPLLLFLACFVSKSFVMQSRAKGSAHRRPQSRAARQQAAQRSVEDKEETLGRDDPGPNPSLSGLVLPSPVKSKQMQPSPTLLNSAEPTALPSSSPSQPSPSEISFRPSVLTLPVSTDTEKRDSSKDNVTTKVLPSSDEDDLFGSDSLFATSVTNRPSTTQTTKTAKPQASSGVGLKKDEDKSTLPSIFDDNTDDLFQKVKPRSTTKKAKAPTFLEEEEDDEDIFGVSNSSTPSSTSSKEIKNSSSFSKQDIFQVFLFYIDCCSTMFNLRHDMNMFYLCVRRMK